MLRNLLLVLALVSTVMAAAGPSRPDFSGTWQFDPSKSSAKTDWSVENSLVIRQSGDRLEMDRMAGEAQLSTGAYNTDGKTRPLYKTPNEEAFLTARWSKKDLVVTVEHSSRGELADSSMKDVDLWTLADGGQTLIHKTSDGKTLVFHKVTGTKKDTGH